MPTPDWLAISLSVAPRPPRVGSRSTWMSCTASSMAATRVCKDRVSDRSEVPKRRPSRTDITATPWSPIVPETRIASPGRASEPLMCTPGRVTPTPVVLMNTPSPLPACTTLVSPVTMGTPASAAACAMELTMRCRSASAKPSSRMNPAESHNGRAPAMATSLTVPWTDRQPMSPPGKNSGETTWLSVAITRRPPSASSGGVASTAWSSRAASAGLSKASRKICSISCTMARPPLPWLMSTRPWRRSSGRV